MIGAQREGEQASAKVSPGVAAQVEDSPLVTGGGVQVSAAPAQGTPPAPQQSATAAPAGTAPTPGNAPAIPATAPPTPSEPAAAPAVTGGSQGVIKVQFVVDYRTQITDANGKIPASALERKGDSLEPTGETLLKLHLDFTRNAQISCNGQSMSVTPFIRDETARLKVGQ